MSDYRFFDRLRSDAAAERRAIVTGLLADVPAIAPKHFYDSVGCALFEAICELPEYYPTRSERAIFAEHREEIANAIGMGRQFVDLGAGDCRKAEAWLPHLAPTRYIAVDIAGDMLARSLARMAPEFPDLELTGIVADFTRGLELRADLGAAPTTFFYPGSSIGNFVPDDARRFLSEIRLHCIAAKGSGLLIGVDIAGDTLARALARMAAEFPDLELTGIVADFTRGLELRADLGAAPTTFFYPGSSIGNFVPDDARRFLSEIRLHCIAAKGSGLLIGVDTKKDRQRLSAAYDDALGVTAAFNRNVLRHVNSIIGSDFDPAAFAHVAFYNERHGRVEMHLSASTSMRVRIDGASRVFSAGDLIHTEYSYKYAPAEFTTLLQDAGFARIRCWQDRAGDFAVYWAT